MKIIEIYFRDLFHIGQSVKIDFSQPSIKGRATILLNNKMELVNALCLAFFGELSEPYSSISPTLETSNGECSVKFSIENGNEYLLNWKIGKSGIERSLRQLSPQSYQFPKNLFQEDLVKLIGLNKQDFVEALIINTQQILDFIHAKESIKPLLLENITNASIYREISQKVFKKTQESHLSLEKLESIIEGISTNKLSEEQLQNTKEELILVENKNNQILRDLVDLKDRLNWYDQYEVAKKELEEADSNLHNARQAYNSMFSQRVLLMRYDKILPFYHLFLSIQNKKDLLEDLKKSIAEKYQQLHEEKTKTDESQKVWKQMYNHFFSTQTEHNLRKDSIYLALQRQGEISGSETFLNFIEDQRKKTSKAIQQCTQDLEEAQVKWNEHIQKIKESNYQLQTISMHSTMMEDIENVLSMFAVLRSLYLNSDECKEKQANYIREIENHKVARNKLSSDFLALRGKKDSLEADIKIHKQATIGQDEKTLRQRIFDLTKQKRDSNSAFELWVRIDEYYGEQLKIKNEISAEESKLQRIEKELVNLQLNYEKSEKQYDIAEKAFLSNQNENIQSIRQQLKEGTPCKVCGATHHPYPSQSAEHLINNLTSELQESQEKRDKARIEFNTVKEERNSTLINLNNSRNALQKVEKELNYCLNQWQQFLDMDSSFEDYSNTVSRVARLSLISNLQDNSIQELDKLEHIYDESQQHEQRIISNYSQINEIDGELAKIEKSIGEQEKTIAVLISEADQMANQIERNHQEIGAIQNRLDGIITLNTWKDRFRNNYDSFIKDVDEIIAKWRENQRIITEEQVLAATDSSKIKYYSSMIEEANKRDTTLQNIASALQQSINSAKLEINQVSGGVLLETFIEQQEASMLETTNKEKDAKNSFEQLFSNQQIIRAKIDSLESLQQIIQEKLRKDNQEMDVLIAQFNHKAESPVQYFEMEKIFSSQTDWLQLRRELEEISNTLLLAQTNKQKADVNLQKLLSSPFHPSESEEESLPKLQSRYDYLLCLNEKHSQRLKEIENILQKHESSVQKLEEIKEKHTKAIENYNLWKKLCDLCGNNDGKSFTITAMHYLLSQIIIRANKRLQIITPRYELRSSENSFNLYLVDHYKFDEIKELSLSSQPIQQITSIALGMAISAIRGIESFSNILFVDLDFSQISEESKYSVLYGLNSIYLNEEKQFIC